MNETLKSIKERRSIRAYKDKKVSKADIETLIDAGMHGPAGISMVSRRFTGIIGEEALGKVNDALRQTFLQLEVTDKMPPFMKRLKENAKDENSNFLYGTPSLIIVSVNEDDTFGEANCAVSLENMMLAAQSLGLDTCWLNQLTRLNDAPPIKALKDELGIPANHKIYGSLSVGYRAMEPDEKRTAIEKSSFKIIE